MARRTPCPGRTGRRRSTAAGRTAPAPRACCGRRAPPGSARSPSARRERGVRSNGCAASAMSPATKTPGPAVCSRSSATTPSPTARPAPRASSMRGLDPDAEHHHVRIDARAVAEDDRLDAVRRPRSRRRPRPGAGRRPVLVHAAKTAPTCSPSTRYSGGRGRSCVTSAPELSGRGRDLAADPARTDDSHARRAGRSRRADPSRVLQRRAARARRQGRRRGSGADAAPSRSRGPPRRTRGPPVEHDTCGPTVHPPHTSRRSSSMSCAA